jgi:hypothetical protein
MRQVDGTGDGQQMSQRQRKIAEIRRTGKTWQWPDTIEHRKWTREHKVAAGWVLFNLACLAWLVWLIWTVAAS